MPRDRAILRRRLNGGPAATLVEQAHNRKLAPVVFVPDPAGGRARPKARGPYVAATYAAISATCPDSCRFKPGGEREGGCYAAAGFTGIRASAMDKAAEARTGLEVIEEEAREIDRAFSGGAVPAGRPLRLHVAGDAHSEAGARLLAGAAERWIARGGGPVWTFTHLWREVPRRAWGPIRCLASVETSDEAIEAAARGYAPALVVPEFPAGRRPIRLGRLRIVPCPEQTRGTTCVQCRICLDQPLEAKGLGVAFAVHGPAAAAARAQLGAPPAAPKRRTRMSEIDPAEDPRDEATPDGTSPSWEAEASPYLERIRLLGRHTIRELQEYAREFKLPAPKGVEIRTHVTECVAWLERHGHIERRAGGDGKIYYAAAGTGAYVGAPLPAKPGPSRIDRIKAAAKRAPPEPAPAPAPTPKPEKSAPMPKPPKVEGLIDSTEAAAILETTPKRVFRLVEEKRLPSQKHGRFLYFDPADVSRYASERAKGGSGNGSGGKITFRDGEPDKIEATAGPYPVGPKRSIGAIKTGPLRQDAPMGSQVLGGQLAKKLPLLTECLVEEIMTREDVVAAIARILGAKPPYA